MEPFFVCGIKIDAAFWTEISALASKLMPLRAPSLIPSGRSHLSRCFWKKPPKILLLRRNPVIALHFLHGWKPFCAPLKKIPSPNPWLEIVLSTYPARISPTIPYSNFCGWKTTRFLKKYSHNPIPQLLNTKNDTFSETFSKKLPALIPQVFSVESKPLFQNFFSTAVTGTFAVLNGIQISKSIKNSACLVFRSRRYIFSGIQL